jgi:CheY-like chemotaxis protein
MAYADSDAAMNRQKRILIIDDEGPVRFTAARCLEGTGCSLSEACNGHHALLLVNFAIKSNTPFDLVLLDIDMMHFQGGKVFDRLVRLDDCPPLLLLTDSLDDACLEMATDVHCLGILTKPFTPSNLKESIAGALAVLSGHASRPSPISLHRNANSPEGGTP